MAREGPEDIQTHSRSLPILDCTTWPQIFPSAIGTRSHRRKTCGCLSASERFSDSLQKFQVTAWR